MLAFVLGYRQVAFHTTSTEIAHAHTGMNLSSLVLVWMFGGIQDEENKSQKLKILKSLSDGCSDAQSLSFG